MSQHGQKALTLLRTAFSNVPEWDKLSPRVQGLLDSVGESFAKHDALMDQLQQVELDLVPQTNAVETALVEELGELQPAAREPNLEHFLRELGLEPSDKPPSIH